MLASEAATSPKRVRIRVRVSVRVGYCVWMGGPNLNGARVVP